MWGFYNKRDRKIASNLFDIFTDFNISEWYKSQKSKTSDQSILAYYVWPLALKNATIHDSYYCFVKGLGNSQPFPTKRTEYYCHVGHIGACNPNNKAKMSICPEKCRPKAHSKEWIYC
jgi:hypothetical protein